MDKWICYNMTLLTSVSLLFVVTSSSSVETFYFHESLTESMEAQVIDGS